MNALHRESRDIQWHTTIPGAEKLRVQPTVASLLDEARPAQVSRSDQLLFGSLEREIIALIIYGRWDHAYAALGWLLEPDAPNGTGAGPSSPDARSGAGRPNRGDDPRKPPAKAPR